MNKKQLITKVSAGVGYLLFAGFSAFFTATSLSLNLMGGKMIWLIFILVLIVAIVAGWCLTNIIIELKKRVGASRGAFVLNLLGFIIFWSFSFTTNVHYFFVEKQGYPILTKELASAKTYIETNTTQSNNAIEKQKKNAQHDITSLVNNNKKELEREINNTLNGGSYVGFGDACIIILKNTESILNSTNTLYNDQNDYIIFDDVRDSGDRGVTQRSRLSGIFAKYADRMQDCLNKKTSVIEAFYASKKNQNTNLLELLDPIANLEQRHLPVVLNDGSATAYYTYQERQQGTVISKMPQDYLDSRYEMDGKTILSYKVYPSERMFDTMSVWGDIAHSRLPLGMSMLQWIVIALIFDIISFVLFYIFRH